MTTCQISNDGGTVVFQALQWEERQRSRPAIRSVPRGTTQHLDDDTYLIENKTVEFTVRLSDSEKTSLIAIFTYNQEVLVQLYNQENSKYWYYTGWLEKPVLNFQYKVESGGTIRWWVGKLTVIANTTTGPYAGNVQEIIDGSFELGTGWVDGNTGLPITGSTDEHYAGLLSLYLYSNIVKQNVAINIPRTNISSFGFWYKAPLGNNGASYGIYYTDATFTNVEISSATPTSWTYFNVLPNVTVGKTVAYIQFSHVDIGGSTSNPSYVDSVSLVSNYQEGLSDTTSEVLLGAGTLDPVGIYLGFITEFERVEEKNVQQPQWLNTAPSISYTFYNRKLVRLSYTFRASDEDKYYIEMLFLRAVLVSLSDSINNIANVSNVWINEFGASYSSSNWLRPWIMTISLLTEDITTA